jgi:hypothetical protein
VTSCGLRTPGQHRHACRFRATGMNAVKLPGICSNVEIRLNVMSALSHGFVHGGITAWLSRLGWLKIFVHLGYLSKRCENQGVDVVRGARGDAALHRRPEVDGYR